MSLLRSNFEAEAGPYRHRKSALMYNAWVVAAGGRIKGAGAPPAAAAAASSPTEGTAGRDGGAGEGQDEDLVVPLWLLKQSNDEQVPRRSDAPQAQLERQPLSDAKSVPPTPSRNPQPQPQVARLFDLLHKLPDTVHWYLEHTVFPTYTQHQHIKLSASGQELGGSMLFDQRIGFSGARAIYSPDICVGGLSE